MNRSYFSSLWIFIPFITISLSIYLYTLDGSPFGVFTHYISHLGIGPNGSNYVFRFGSMVSGVVMIFFFLNLSVYLIKKEVPKKYVNISLVFGLLSSVGNILTGFFPGDGSQDLHNFVASFFFLGGLAYCILYGISELKGNGISKFQALSGFVVAFFFVVFIFFNTLNYYNPELALELSHISEWILFTLLMFWIFEHEISMKRDKRLS